MAQFRVEFLKSCAALGDLPVGETAEVAVLGRSNVGKSSLLNTLAEHHQLARASRTPGRTRLLNVFSVNSGQLHLVDCPGYGYARAARTLREQWSEVMRQYLEGAPQLRLCLLLVDARLDPQALDLEACAWLRRRGRELQIVATKWDRLSGNQRPLAQRRLAAAFAADPLPFSSVTGEGRDRLRTTLLAHVE